jgi:hypothetical protein
LGEASRRVRFLGAMDFPCPFWSASSSLCRRSKSQVGNESRISRLSSGSFHAALLLSLSLAASPLPAGTHLAQRGALCLRGGSGGGGVGVGGVDGGRGGEGGDQVRIGISSTAKQHSDDPVCFRLSSSNALQREWETAKASPTAQVPQNPLNPKNHTSQKNPKIFRVCALKLWLIDSQFLTLGTREIPKPHAANPSPL